MLKKILILSSLCVFITGCAIAPLSNNFTGRSLGKKGVEIEGGAVVAGAAIPSFKFSYGVSSDFDLGIHYDSYCIGLFGKYSIINNNEGFATAGLFGGGATVNGYYLYAGPVLSFKTGFFEPYFVGRFNYVHYDEFESDFDIEPGNYSYLQLTGGSVFWISKKIGLNVEVSAFTGATGAGEIAAPIFLGGLRLRF